MHFSIPLLESEQLDVKNRYRPSLCTHIAQSIKLRKQKLLNTVTRGTHGDAKMFRRKDKHSIVGWVGSTLGAYRKRSTAQRRRGQGKREPQISSDNGSSTKMPQAFSKVTNSEIKV